MGKAPFQLFKDTVKNINGPKYNYLKHIKYPVDFPVKMDGSIFSDTVIKDIDAIIYYRHQLTWQYCGRSIILS